MSDEDDDAGDGQAPTQAATEVKVSPAALALTQKWLQGQGSQGIQKAVGVAAALADEGDDDDAGDPAPAPVAAKPAAPEPEVAPEAEVPEVDDLAERLARVAAGDTRPSRKDELRSQLAARGLPEALVHTLVNHGKTKEIEAWLAQPLVSSPPDTARQPSASPVAAPAPTPPGAQQEPALREALAGVRSALESTGVFEKGDIESLVGPIETLGQRVERLERSQAEVIETSRQTTHETKRTAYQREIDAAKEGLADQFPQVLDSNVYRDRIAPTFEALATNPATAKRSLAENLAAACRAELVETDADRTSRKIRNQDAARHTPTTPRTRATSSSKITKQQFAAGVIKLKLGGASKDDIESYTEQWTGRVV